MMTVPLAAKEGAAWGAAPAQVNQAQGKAAQTVQMAGPQELGLFESKINTSRHRWLMPSYSGGRDQED
jgi:hypothetical protein